MKKKETKRGRNNILAGIEEEVFGPKDRSELRQNVAFKVWLQREEKRKVGKKERARQRIVEKMQKAEEIATAGGSLEDMKNAMGKKLFKRIELAAGKQIASMERAKNELGRNEISIIRKEEYARSSAIRIAERNKDPGFCYRKIQGFAKSRGESFELALEEFNRLWCGSCFYCGDPDARGLDRTDPALGYSPKNLVSCCSQCKKLKGTNKRNVFLNLCRKIANRHPWNNSDGIRRLSF